MTKRQQQKLGNIYAIPLPDNTFAFGRQYKEFSLAIYKERSKNKDDIPQNKEIDFFVGVYRDLLTDGEWPKVDNIPFDNEDDVWPPKTFIKDQLKPDNYEIYYKGEIVKATKKECLGLEVTAAWDRQHVVDRLMGNDTWTEICE